jgi:hypothetical protein
LEKVATQLAIAANGCTTAATTRRNVGTALTSLAKLGGAMAVRMRPLATCALASCDDI